MPSPCAVSGNLLALTNGAIAQGTVTFQLGNLGSGNPITVSGTGIFPNLKTVCQSAENGSFAVSIWGNDNISPSNTIYLVTFRDPLGNEVGPIQYFIAGNSANLNSLSAATSISPPVLVIGLTNSNINNIIYVDGVTYPKNSAGIAAAIVAAQAIGGATIVLPPGTINLTASVIMTGGSPVAINLIGAGRQATILQMVDATNNIPGIQPYSNCRIAHLTLVGTNSAGTANGITAGGVTNVTIEDVDLQKWPNQQINSGAGSSNWIIKNNFIHSGLNEGILYGSASGGIIENNVIYLNAANGIDIGGSNFVTITGNTIFQNGGIGSPGNDLFGICLFAMTGLTSCKGNTITGNAIYANNTHGISVKVGTGGQTWWNTISGNLIENNGIGTAGNVFGDGIVLDNGGSNGTILGTTISGNTIVGNSRNGIFLYDAGASANITDTTITANTVLNNGGGTFGGTGIITNNAGFIFDTIIEGNTVLSNITAQITNGSGRTVIGGNHTQTSTGIFEVPTNIQLGISGSVSGAITLEGSISGACTVIAPATASVAGNPVVSSNAWQAPALIVTAATPTGSAGQLSLGTTVGFGAGSAGTAVTTTTKGAGTGPTTPQTIVNYLEIDIAGTKFWVPLVQ